MKSLAKLWIVLAVCPAALFAQIPNPGFELTDTAGVLLNWRYTGIVSITIGDSIIYDGPLTGKSTNARTGLYALELRNSYNYTTGGQFMNGAVSATLVDTNSYLGFTDRIPLATKPLALEFYYKYSQNPYNDSTVCEVKVYNTDDYEIGSGSAVVYGAAGNYQLKTININYITVIAPGNGNLLPSYSTIDFRNKLSGGTAHIGQHTLIDDVSFKYSTVSIAEFNSTFDLQIFPNPAKDIVTVNAEYPENIKVFDLAGRLVLTALTSQISTAQLPNGIYLIELKDTFGTHSNKLVIAH